MKKFYFGILSFIVLLNSAAFVTKPEDECPSDGETYYSLEDALKEPEKVKILDLSLQKLTAVPASIAQLKNLECLDLSFNRISTLPVEMKSLTKLKYLNLCGTRYMAKLPEVVKEIPSLQILNIADHPEWPATRYDEVVKMLPKVKVITKVDANGETDY